MTHNQAISHLVETNNETEAFAIALQDEGINQDVSFEQWIGFARQCIANREAEASTPIPAAYYS